MFTLLRFTLREALQRKVFLVSVVMAVIFLGLFSTGVYFAVRDIEKAHNQMAAAMVYPQLLLMGLYFGGFIVSFLAVLSSAGIISSEVESGTIQAVITKPLRRSEIVLGKFFGQAIFVTFYAGALFAVIYAVIAGMTGMELAGGWRAALLFCLQPVVLLAVTLLASTLTSTIACGTFVFMLYAVAFIGGIVEQIGWMIDNIKLINAGIVASLIMPVDALYRKIVHVLMQPGSNPVQALHQMGPFGSLAEPSVWMVVYAGLYVLTCLLVALYSFERKDI